MTHQTFTVTLSIESLEALARQHIESILTRPVVKFDFYWPDGERLEITVTTESEIQLTDHETEQDFT